MYSPVMAASMLRVGVDIVNVDGAKGESVSAVYTTGGAHLSWPSALTQSEACSSPCPGLGKFSKCCDL